MFAPKGLYWVCKKELKALVNDVVILVKNAGVTNEALYCVIDEPITKLNVILLSAGKSEYETL